jgi:hypothetical protein
LALQRWGVGVRRESRDQREGKSRKGVRAESREQRAESREQRAESREQRAESREQREHTFAAASLDT